MNVYPDFRKDSDLPPNVQGIKRSDVVSNKWPSISR